MESNNNLADLYLGYDADCLKCSAIATRIESEVGGVTSLSYLSARPKCFIGVKNCWERTPGGP